ncbi:MAG: type 4a pilus biogenesis protein PilO [Phycisphaerales bacterium]|jgi:Tfp pilus assembly protein PilO|nr:type 4a pilus biogenesis protein PilO [Phycisphaerales bacterium]
MIRIASVPTPVIHAGGVAIIACVAGAWYALALGPLENARAHAHAEAGELSREQASMEQLRDQHRLLSAEHDRLREQLDERIDVLPRSRMNERLAGLTSLATEYGLTIDELTPKEGIVRGALAEVPINARVRGGYADVSRFIGALHDRTPDIDVRGFDIEGTPARGSEDVRAVFALAWYADPAGG